MTRMMSQIRRTGVVVALLVGTSGCLPRGKSDIRRETEGLIGGTGSVSDGNGGRVIVPKRNGLKTAIIVRDPGDAAIGDPLWSVADEQTIPLEVRNLLHANGMRIGLVAGSLPVQTESIMSENEPRATRVDPVLFDLPDGDPSEIDLAHSTEPVTLLLTREGRSMGKDYDEARGVLRINANQDGNGGVNLKITPEIHHGPVTREFAAAPTNGELSPSEFVVRTGRKVEHFRDLAVTLRVMPGQAVVVGATDSREGSRDLGGFLFTETEQKSDRVRRKVLLIWANPYGGLNLNTVTPARDVPASSLPTRSMP
ncbi:MAG: hypothetical protein SFX72_15645 [Isosphaeraceae bacterium]|nr:hypothetical protein [Isosphaeraceae bacterium]